MKQVFSTKYKVQSHKMHSPGIKLVLIIMILFAGMAANAQKLIDTVPQKNQVEMATGMRSSGKIFVVVAVMSMILIGLFIYLFTLDKKITKLEKEK